MYPKERSIEMPRWQVVVLSQCVRGMAVPLLAAAAGGGAAVYVFDVMKGVQ